MPEIIIEHEQYYRVSDRIYALGFNADLKLVVELFKEKDGIKNSYHKEYSYTMRNMNIASIKRSFGYHLDLEVYRIPPNNTKKIIRIGVEDLLYLNYTIAEIAKWFYSKEYEGMFELTESGLCVSNNFKNTKFNLELYSKSVLAFVPTTITYDDGTYNSGVRIYMPDKDDGTVFIDVVKERFLGLCGILKNIDIYGCAQAMIQYVGNPGFGTNCSVIENKPNTEAPNYTKAPLKTIMGRTPRLRQ